MSFSSVPQHRHDLEAPHLPRSLLEEGAEAERAGRSAEARAIYERALHSLAPAEGLTAATLARRIARCHSAEGDHEAAEESAGLALAIAEAHASDEAVAQALNVLGVLSQSRGDLDAAAAHYGAAEARAAGTGDLRLAAILQLNLGTVAGIHGDFEQARARYEQCLVGFRAVGAEDYISHVLNNLGMLHTQQGKWAAAERDFEGALESCVRSGSPVVQVMVQTNLADLYVASRRIDAAEGLCEEAWTLLRRVGDPRAEGELCRVHGIVLRERGELRLADARFRRAAVLAEERGDLLLAAEVLREQAALFSRQDRHRETLEHLNRSLTLFWRLRARRDIADLSGRIESLEETYLNIVARWGDSIESADLYTHGHCVRVADYACALARAAGVDEPTLLWFRMGALLHDVGKIVIPPEVLNKPGGFTPQERVSMERHPDAGVELLGDLEFPWDIRPMIRHHHERWSGGGYPTGVAGEAIPLAARILSVADVFDALTSDRPYRPAFAMREALDLMGDSLRAHFDPDLLERWMQLCVGGEITILDSTGGEGTGERPGALPTVLIVGESHAPAELEGIAEGWAGGARFLLADGWDRAREIASAEEISTIVVGVRGEMPGCIGTLSRARAELPELPVLALLDREDEALALRLLGAGAQDTLVSHATDGFLFARALRRALARGRLQRELHARTQRDDLTGLHNRRGLFSLAPRLLESAPASAPPPVLLVLDVDSLRSINARHGHTDGDCALLELAALLHAEFPSPDLAARVGGDEFAVLTRTDADPAALVRRVEAAVDRANGSPDRVYRLTVSVGAAVVVGEGESVVADALYRADREMYARKRGRPA